MSLKESQSKNKICRCYCWWR